MNETRIPKITFGIIVLNGEPFTRYCLRSIYPFAYEIIVVEGGHEDTKSVCTPDGHSVDNTLEILYKFKEEEDVENKLTIITRNGFWPKKDELGNDRTPQSRAYADCATGDYLWQIDIDEFYCFDDMLRIIDLLQNNPTITTISFPTHTFWGDINYTADSWALRRGAKYYHRLFKWSADYKYLTHEPPTIIDKNGIDLRSKHWITGEMMEKKNIFMYHYSLLFPWQVEQKVKVYKDEKPESCDKIIDWAANNYFKLSHPYHVHNIYRYPGWLLRFKGEHPKEVKNMMKDIVRGDIKAEIRQTEDVEQLLNKWWYPIGIIVYKILDSLFFNFLRFKSKFAWLKKYINKILKLFMLNN